MAEILVHDALKEQLARKLPERPLSDDDIRRIGDTMARVRAVSERLGQLEHTAESALARRRDQALLTAELAELAEITGMSAAEFSDALSDEGLTTEATDQEEIALEPLPPAH